MKKPDQEKKTKKPTIDMYCLYFNKYPEQNLLKTAS